MLCFKILGIRTEFHLSYFLLVGLLCISGHCLLAAAATGFSYLHEAAHGAAAKRLGYTPEKISAGLFGGILHLRESVIKPKDQLFIHLAGPFFNAMAAGLLFWLYQAHPRPWVMDLLVSNLILALFNLMPFYPLDGGKLVNLYLAFFLGFRRAELVSHFFSRLFSIFLFLLGIYLVQYNLVNLLISALAVNLAIAEHDDNSFLFYKLTKNIAAGTVGREPKLMVCRSDDSAYRILSSYKPQENRLFTVVNHKGSYRGQLTEEDVIAGIYHCGIYADFHRLLRWKRDKTAGRGKK